MDQVNGHIDFGTTTIRYSVEYSARKTLKICVRPDCSVVVTAPLDALPEKIRAGVHRRAAWIVRQQRTFEAFGEHTPERRYVSGETHLYLGRQYMLRVVCGGRNEVHYKGNILEVECKDRKNVKTLLLAWYRQRGELKFRQYAVPWTERFKCYGVESSGLHLKYMPARWGSCTSAGEIFLNPLLIKAPRACIEYVIVHELCHLVYRNHTKDFYNLLSREMPSWQKWKQVLECTLM